MARRRKPQSAYQISLDSLVHTVATLLFQFGDHEPVPLQTVSQIQQFVLHIPYFLADDYVSGILHMVNRLVFVNPIVLGAVLHPSCTKMNLYQPRPVQLTRALVANLYVMPQLKTLHLNKHCTCFDIKSGVLTRSLDFMSNLVSLHFACMIMTGKSNALRYLSKKCPNLRELTIDHGVPSYKAAKAISKCEGLKTLMYYRYSRNGTSTRHIMLLLGRLKHLEVFCFAAVRLTSLLIHLERRKMTYGVKDLSFEVSGGKWSHLGQLVASFPGLESVELLGFSGNWLPLRQLPHIRSIAMSTTHPNADQLFSSHQWLTCARLWGEHEKSFHSLFDGVKVTCNSLTQLYLGRWKDVDLEIVNSVFPNVSDMRIVSCSLDQNPPDTKSQSFTHLQSVELDQFGPITKHHLLYLLGCCRDLLKVKFSSIDDVSRQLDDDLFKCLLKKNPMSKVMEAYFESDGLSKDIFPMLIEGFQDAQSLVLCSERWNELSLTEWVEFYNDKIIYDTNFSFL